MESGDGRKGSERGARMETSPGSELEKGGYALPPLTTAGLLLECWCFMIDEFIGFFYHKELLGFVQWGRRRIGKNCKQHIPKKKRNSNSGRSEAHCCNRPSRIGPQELQPRRRRLSLSQPMTSRRPSGRKARAAQCIKDSVGFWVDRRPTYRTSIFSYRKV